MKPCHGKANLFEMLRDPKQNRFIKVGDELFTFESPGVDVVERASLSAKGSWSTEFDNPKLPILHRNTVKLLLGTMEHFVDGKKKEKLTVSDIEHVITDSLDIFDQSLVQSNVY